MSSHMVVSCFRERESHKALDPVRPGTLWTMIHIYPSVMATSSIVVSQQQLQCEEYVMAHNTQMCHTIMVWLVTSSTLPSLRFAGSGLSHGAVHDRGM